MIVLSFLPFFLFFLACKKEEESIKKDPTGSIIITAFGASIVQGDKDNNFEDSLQVFLAQTLKTPVTVYNRGIGGQTTRDGLARIKKTLDETRPDYTLITLGTNDALLATTFSTPLTETYNNMDAILATCLKNNTKPILSSLTGVDTLKRDLPLRKNLKLVNTAYEQIARKYGIPFLDLDTPLSGHSDFFNSDGIHLNAKGYQVVALEWHNIISKSTGR